MGQLSDRNQNMLQQLTELADFPRSQLSLLPTPIHPLKNFGSEIGIPELWLKRDDLTGLAGGGNKTRKLEFLVGEAIASGADMLVTVGAIQSNHTRQTAAAAAKTGLKCALLHCAWTNDAGPNYRWTGNILLSQMVGASLYWDGRVRPIEDQGPLPEFISYLQAQGHSPYLIPGGGSEHRLGSLGYVVCAAEIARQMDELGIRFDYVVHCTGSSSTQAGLLAGFAALGISTRVIGIPDDAETIIKKKRVLRLANATLDLLGISVRVKPADVKIIVGDRSPYGVADEKTLQAIARLAKSEGVITDPVYEGKAVRGALGTGQAGSH